MERESICRDVYDYNNFCMSDGGRKVPCKDSGRKIKVYGFLSLVMVVRLRH